MASNWCGTKHFLEIAKVGTKLAQQYPLQSFCKGAKQQKVNIAKEVQITPKDLNKFLEKQNKNQDKLRTKKEEKKKSQSIEKKREKEKQLESKK